MMWITLQCDASTVGVLCIYASTTAAEISWFWDQIVDVDSWIVGGDFNNLGTFEVWRAVQSPTLPHIARCKRDAQDRFLFAIAGVDAWHIPSFAHVDSSLHFSWGFHRQGGLLLKRLDRFLWVILEQTQLKLRGIHVEEEGTVTDSELIMEVLEIRETLQSKPAKGVLESLNKQAMARMDEWSRAFKTALDESNTTAAVGALQRMSYFGRACEDIKRELL
ncbi:hypothetical protein L7F22_012538 [Adiantum nelumboides]|nr:hypothetical protein [Adiantum nelumboides]